MAVSSLRVTGLPRASLGPVSSSHAAASSLVHPTSRSFTSSPPLHVKERKRNARKKVLTIRKKAMWAWLKGPGAIFEEPRAKSTNYITAYDQAGRPTRPGASIPPAYKDELVDDSRPTEQGEEPQSEHSSEELKPFPLNSHFISPNVLSLPLRDEIYRRVVEQEQTVREVAQSLGISMLRVGAVVRLKTVENDTIRENKAMARPYQRAMLNMLPQTPFIRSNPVDHEPINDLPVHTATLKQMFHPTSESRQFTREDAGKVFNPTLRPADERIPHPDMIVSASEQGLGLAASERESRRRARWDAEMTARDNERVRQEEIRAKREVMVAGQRWDFKITKVQVDQTGNSERSVRGIGWRYGFPLPDRKKGQVWIPTKVE